MPFAEVNKIKIFYEIQGTGYPVIMHHGYGATGSIWIGQVKELSKYFKLIILDARSSGKSDHPTNPYTLDTLVEDLKGLMDSLKIEKAHIIGQSMGGWIAQNFVLKYPARVNKIVLLGTNHKGSGIQIFKDALIKNYEQQKQDKVQAYWDYAKFTHHRKFIKEMQADQKKKFHGLWSAEDMIKELTENKMTPKDYQLLADAVEKHDVTERLPQIKNPVLLIAATNDKLSPKMVMEEIHKGIKNSKFELIDDTAHHVFLEAAPKVNQLIIDFLKS
jgi:proline-specific peptidase